MQREIKLDGGEISILKTLGLSGSPMNGRTLLDRACDMEFAELVDTLHGLIVQGYVLSHRVSLHTREDVERSSFRVNPSYSRDLRDALRPGGARRREERPRRSSR